MSTTPTPPVLSESIYGDLSRVFPTKVPLNVQVDVPLGFPPPYPNFSFDPHAFQQYLDTMLLNTLVPIIEHYGPYPTWLPLYLQQAANFAGMAFVYNGETYTPVAAAPKK